MKNWPCGRLQYHLYSEYCDLSCNLYFLSEKGRLGILCGIVKSRFSTDADAETEKKPLIHSKVKTVGCVNPRTCKYSSEQAKIPTLWTSL